MQSMARVLVTEEISDSGLQRLVAAGHTVDVRLGLSRRELLGAVGGAEALIIRSATTVDGELLAAADRLDGRRPGRNRPRQRRPRRAPPPAA